MVIKNKIKKNIKVINIEKIFIIIISFFILSASLVFADEGDDNEIGISTCEELQNMKEDLSLNYKLTNNIECSDTINWNSGNGFNPIGSSSNKFNGNFDGQNFTISNLFINRSNENFVGLFGYLNSGVVIENVGLVDVEVYGKWYVGGLAGYGNSVTFTNNFATGSLSGNDYVGGLAGYGDDANFTNNYATGSVNGNNEVGGLVGRGFRATFTNNYATGSVNGNNEVGGLVGGAEIAIFTNNFATGSVSGNNEVGGLVGYSLSSTFTNNYATGSVNGNNNVGGLVGQGGSAIFTNNYATGSVSGDSNVGGFAGGKGSCSATNSFYDISTTGQTDEGCGIGSTTSELQTPTSNIGIYANWDTIVWNFVKSNEYPRLNWQYYTKISTCEQLQNMSQDLSANYLQTQNIDCSDTINWNGGSGFEPIGSSSNKFKGNFDGQNFTISNLYINRGDENNVGLFGYLNSGVVIENVGLVDVEVYGDSNVGGIAGAGRSSTFKNNSVTGSVSGEGYVGGLVGSGGLTIFTNNFAKVSVSGSDFVGGLVGAGYKAIFTNNYAIEGVSGNKYVGGLVGGGYKSTFTNSYATGNVNGNGNVGGLIGAGTLCSATNSYYSTLLTGQINSGCGEGKTTQELQTPTNNIEIYINWDTSVWNFGTSSEYPRFNWQENQISLGYKKISTCEQLQNINQNLLVNYTLTKDIDCSDSINWNGGKGFEPIGSSSNKFSGNFDGQNFTISNLFINRSNEEYVGLFGYLNSGVVIENVGLVDVEVYGKNNVGGIAGRWDSVTFTNSYATGIVSWN